jgi:hypothetical protein
LLLRVQKEKYETSKYVFGCNETPHNQAGVH